jgi:surface protein
MIKKGSETVDYVAITDANNNVDYPVKVWFANANNTLKLVYERPSYDIHIINLAINAKLGNANKVTDIIFTNNLSLRNQAYNNNIVNVTYQNNIPTFEFLIQNQDNTTFTCYIANAFYSQNKKVICHKSFNACFAGTIAKSFSFLSNFDTSDVNSMSSMFYNINSAINLNLSMFDTSNVTNMDRMFEFSKFISLNLSSFDTSNVTSMIAMLGLSTIKEIDLSNFNTSNVVNMQALFYSATGLKKIDISTFDTAKVTNMSGLFQYCENVERIIIGNNFDTSKNTDFSNFFANNYKLKYFDITKLNTSSASKLVNMFATTTIFRSFNLKNFNLTNATDVSGMFSSIANLFFKRIFSHTYINNNIISDNLFRDDIYLVGGNGTTFDANYTDAVYARIDGENGLPGYFCNPADAITLTLVNVDNQNYSDKLYFLSGDTYTIPSLQGYTATVTDNNGNTYTDGDTITINQDIILNFVWTATS